MKLPDPSPEESRHEKSMKEGRQIIEDLIGKDEAKKYFLPHKGKKNETDEEALNRILRDARSDDMLLVVKVDPNLFAFKKDPDLTRAIATVSCMFSMGADTTVSDAQSLIDGKLSAMRNGGVIERKIELYHFIKENAQSLGFPPAENAQEWTKILRDVGLDHVGLHAGESKY